MNLKKTIIQDGVKSVEELGKAKNGRQLVLNDTENKFGDILTNLNKSLEYER